MATGRKNRDPRNVIHTDEVLRKMLTEALKEPIAEMTAEILKLTARIGAEVLEELTAEIEKVKALGELYDKQTAENEAIIAKHEAKIAEHEAKTATNEIIAAQHAAKAAEYKEMSAKLEEVLIVAENLSNLSNTGTELLKALTPRQIEFKKQVNQRAELTHKIANKIKTSNTSLSENRYDELEKQVTLLEKDFQALAQHIDTENEAQDEVIKSLDQYEDTVNQMKSELEKINHQPDYYKTLKEKLYDTEFSYLEQANSAFEANRPAKERSDKLGSQCKQAFSLIKQRLQQKEVKSSPSSSRVSTPPLEVKGSPLSKSSNSDDDLAIEDIDRSSPSSSRSQSSDSDDEKKDAEKEQRAKSNLSSNAMVSSLLPSASITQSRPSSKADLKEPLSVNQKSQIPAALQQKDKGDKNKGLLAKLGFNKKDESIRPSSQPPIVESSADIRLGIAPQRNGLNSV